MAKRNRKSQKRRKNQRKRGTRRRIRGGETLKLVSEVKVVDNVETSTIYIDEHRPTLFDRGMATVAKPAIDYLIKDDMQEFQMVNGYNIPSGVIMTDVDGKQKPLKMKTYDFKLIDGEWVQIYGPTINQFYGYAGAEVLHKLNKGVVEPNPTVIKNSRNEIIYPQPT
jgi:hypothetical protein